MRVLLALCTGLLTFSFVQADSLWERRDPRFANMFKDNRARLVGDLLTIVVRENTDIDNKDEREMQKETRTEGRFDVQGNSQGNRLGRRFSANFRGAARSNREFDGKAEFSSDRRLLDGLTVTVVEVLPNDNLVIEGYRKRAITGDARIMRVSGVVRPADIGAGNTIRSQSIANFSVTYEGRGPEMSYTSNGWLGKIMNAIWPF